MLPLACTPVSLYDRVSVALLPAEMKKKRTETVSQPFPPPPEAHLFRIAMNAPFILDFNLITLDSI